MGYNMVKIYGKGYSMSGMEKVTFNLPSDIKARVVELKDELNLSMSSIYTQAIKSYLDEQERKKWQTASTLASKDEEYLSFIKEMGEVEEDIYDYQTV